VARRNTEVYVENIEGGYRCWCAVCGAEEIIPIPPTGMPIEVLAKWTETFEKLHRDCKRDPASKMLRTQK